MHQDDRAVLEAAGHARRDAPRIRGGHAVERAHAPADHLQAKLLHDPRDRGVCVADRRAKEDRLVACDLGEDGDRLRQIVPDVARALERKEAVVRVAVERDGVPAREDLANEIGALLGLAADHEERRLRLRLVEQIQDRRGRARARAVVERERHAARAFGAPRHDVDEHAEAEEEDAAKDDRDVSAERERRNEHRQRAHRDRPHHQGEGADRRGVEEDASRGHRRRLSR